MNKKQATLAVFIAIILLVVIAVCVFSTQMRTAVSTMKDSLHVPAAACTNLVLTNHLELGSRDSTTDGEVSKLQAYLATWGKKYQNSLAEHLIVTGYFGTDTQKALTIYQSLHSIPSNSHNDTAITVTFNDPDYGQVGPRTRELFKKNCLEGGFSPGYTQPSTDPLLSDVEPTTGSFSLSEPLTVTVQIKPVTFQGFVEIHLVPAAARDDWQKQGIEVAQLSQIRNGYSGTLRFTIIDFSGGGLPQSPEAKPITPGDYVIVAKAYDGSEGNARSMVASSNVITLTK